MRRMFGLVLALAGCVGDGDPPEILELTPSEGAELVGAGTVRVNALIRDDSAITAEVVVDGTTSLGSFSEDGCEEGCAFVWTWDSSAVPAGIHDIRLVATDRADNTSDQIHGALVDDMIVVKALQVGAVPESDMLEIEVYLIDDATDALLGCSGSRHGLDVVDATSTRYTLDAKLANTGGELPLGALDFADTPARFEVWEDDDVPVCPVTPDPLANDLVGASSPSTAAELKANRTKLAFGNVAELEIAFVRPLTLSDTPRLTPPPPPTHNFDFGGATCSTGAGGAGLVLGVLLLGLRRRRRA